MANNTEAEKRLALVMSAPLRSGPMTAEEFSASLFSPESRWVLFKELREGDEDRARALSSGNKVVI